MVMLLIAGSLLVWFGWRVWRSPGRAYNGMLLVAALFFSWLGTTWLLGSSGYSGLGQLLGAGVLFGGLLAVVVASIWLIVNGVTVMVREGVRTSTILPLIFGLGSLAALALPIVASALVWNPDIPTWVIALSWLIFLSYGYIGFHLVAYTVYALIYSRLPQLPHVDAVVVLGCGLSRGHAVTPLLASRLRRGLEMRTNEIARGGSPILVASGGQGPDEQRPEAEAMAEWLIENGVPAGQIRQENRSRTTEQNLLFSRELVQDATSVVVATSNYHVLRTAALARKLGLNWRIVGAPTASYYAPTAFLREFIAHLTYAWKWHLLVAGLLAASIFGLWLISVASQ